MYEIKSAKEAVQIVKDCEYFERNGVWPGRVTPEWEDKVRNATGITGLVDGQLCKIWGYQEAAKYLAAYVNGEILQEANA